MGTGTEAPVKAKVKYLFGNVHPEDIVFTDLETGPDGAKQAFKMAPGDVVDLEDYFDEKDLRVSRSLKIAINSGWIRPCKSLDEEIEVPVITLQGGRAPINEFDRILAGELQKEKDELERLKEGRDGLASRVKDLEK